MDIDQTDFDAIVVGAGAVGLAIGRALGRAGLSTLILEKEASLGQGVSSRNSEVIHAGLYYPTDSLRARFCVRGRRLLYAFLDARGVHYERCGKMLVAVDKADMERLLLIHAQARRNGVEALTLLGGPEAVSLEPALHAVGALLSPETGIFDSHGYMLALGQDVEEKGGLIVFRSPFLGARQAGAGIEVQVGGEQPTCITTKRLVIAAGLDAQDAAGRVQDYPAAAIPPRYLGKGSYFALNVRAPFRRLIYPTPVPGALGVHFTLDLNGRGRFGPDLDYVDAEDWTIDSSKAARFARDIRQYWPDLPDGALTPDYVGIRPKLHGPGQPQPDFRIDGPEVHGIAGLITLFGIESPGLTSSLAIGEEIAKRFGAAAG